MQCLNEILATSVRLYGDRDFIITDAETVTYTEFDRRTSRLANVLRDMNVQQGDPVGIYLPSNLDMAVGIWACQKLGAIATPMSSMYRITEVENIVSSTHMAVMITDADGLSIAGTLPNGSLHHILTISGEQTGGRPLQPLLKKAADTIEMVQCQPDDPACLFFTSGTTGRSKGAVQTQLNQYAGILSQFYFIGLKRGSEVIMNVLPLFNNFGATSMMNLCVYAGGTLVLHERWNTEAIMADIKTHKATYFAGTPTMFVYFCNTFDPDKHDFSSLHRTLAAGAPLAPETYKKFSELSGGARMLQAYGATETVGVVTTNSDFSAAHAASVGQPFGDMLVEIIDDDGNVLPTGERGEIRVTGQSIIAGYWRDPEATANGFSDGRWLSGDIGYLDDENYLYIVDRKKDVIISGGFNIYPAELEAVLYALPWVATCSVVGLPDDIKGEIPVAVIIAKPGVQPDAAEITQYFRDKIAAYKIPRQIYLTDQMPLGPTEKILKRELREILISGQIKPLA